MVSRPRNSALAQSGRQLAMYLQGLEAQGQPASAALGGVDRGQAQQALAAAGYSQAQINQMLGTKGSLLQRTLFGIGSAASTPAGIGYTAPADAAAVDSAATDASSAGGSSNLSKALAGGGLFAAVAGGIGSTLDFLKLIAWLFYPRNILRAIEFVIGAVLMVFGFWAAMQARGESREGFETGEIALTRSGVGRVGAALGRAARGQGGSIESAPHRTRRSALRHRYTREQTVRRRHLSKPAGHHRRGKGPGGTGP